MADILGFLSIPFVYWVSFDHSWKVMTNDYVRVNIIMRYNEYLENDYYDNWCYQKRFSIKFWRCWSICKMCIHMKIFMKFWCRDLITKIVIISSLYVYYMELNLIKSLLGLFVTAWDSMTEGLELRSREFLLLESLILWLLGVDVMRS